MQRQLLENALKAGFFHTVKTELIHDHRNQIREKAKQAIFKYIEVFI